MKFMTSSSICLYVESAVCRCGEEKVTANQRLFLMMMVGDLKIKQICLTLPALHHLFARLHLAAINQTSNWCLRHLEFFNYLHSVSRASQGGDVVGKGHPASLP